MDIPLAESLDIPDLNFETAEIVCSNRVKGNIKKNKRPLEEGVDGVC